MGNSACNNKLKTFVPKANDVEQGPIMAETPDKDQVKVLPHDPRSPTDGILRTPIQISESPGEIGDQKVLIDCQFTPTGTTRSKDVQGCVVPASQRIGPPYYVKDLEAMDGVESDGDEDGLGESHFMKKETQGERVNDPICQVRSNRFPALPLRFGHRGARHAGSPSDLVREKQRREFKERSFMKENNPPPPDLGE